MLNHDTCRIWTRSNGSLNHVGKYRYPSTHSRGATVYSWSSFSVIAITCISLLKIHFQATKAYRKLLLFA